ncbi:MAG: HAMP domain-containing histidine kinase [Planctomycetes bacterium]|nr:HAMP domain-containing histidine kinase [Planctomycetota bacterium]
MLRLETTTRRSLLLYGALLVLPTLIFGWLYWSELQKDFDRERQAIPEKALDDARKIVEGMNQRLENLVVNESKRPFTQYAALISAEVLGDDLVPLPTQLETSPAIPGVLGWFSFNRDEGPDGEIRAFVGQGIPDRDRQRTQVQGMVRNFRTRKQAESLAQRLGSSAFEGAPLLVPLRDLALSLGKGDAECAECVRRCLPKLRDKSLEVGVSDFELSFYRDAEQRPVAIASRRIFKRNALDPELLQQSAPCLAPLEHGLSLKQGFVLDPQWLFKDLPWDIAQTVLDQDEELRTPPEALPIDSIGSRFAEIRPVPELGFEIYYPEDANYGRLEIMIDDERFEERVARQSQRFLTTGGMLLLTLAIGMTLLYRSVRRELDQAHRMQNFVAAVTHELRTPISTIRLHAEMLQDGWVDAQKQPEYYGRIVRETQRLSTLVERVLEKSRLKENVTRPEAGDLNELVLAQKDDLEPPEGERSDLAFQLEPKLPKVWLTAEGVGMILSNLVENARKYAPAKGEPILVRTRWSNGRVLLEVCDRGPGVPPTEREKIFEAFYRIGSEQTRTTTGTGLGLHLVRLHAETCGAQSSVEEREGGGSVFRVAFRPAD